MAIVSDSTNKWIRTAGATYFDFFTNSDYANPIYEATVYKVDTIKSLGIAPKVIEKIINASGAIRDRLIIKKGADITVDMTEIPTAVMNKAEGVTAADGFVVYKETTEGTEFAFGAVFKKRDGSYAFRWFPRCRMQPTEMSAETETEEDIPDPQQAVSIVAMPLANGVWCVAYNTADVSGTALTEAEFFAAPYTDDDDVANQTDFMNIIPVAALPTENIDATAVYVLTADDIADEDYDEGTMWRYLSETWTEYTVS